MQTEQKKKIICKNKKFYLDILPIRFAYIFFSRRLFHGIIIVIIINSLKANENEDMEKKF